MGDKELSLIDKQLTSLKDVPLSPAVTSLNLHCNHIPRIEGLSSAWHLHYLDLSSNRISKIEGLSSLTSLRTLNLSSNLITKVEGLNGLVNLKKLNLSYNKINNITGLLYLHGSEYKLKHLSLHANLIDSIDHLLQCLLGLQGLRSVTLNQDGGDNPICIAPGYWEIVMESLPQISVLDGLDRLRHPSSPGISSDIPGLDDYVDFLLSSDTSYGEAIIVEERDQEMERRWKAEQAVRKLTEELKCLQTKVSEEKDLQSMALHTTDRLKELLLKERSGRSELQARVEELETRCQSLSRQLEQARSSEEQHRAALQRLEETVSHGDALRARQQAEEMKRHQEVENKAAALKRELDIQKVAVRQHKDKLQQLHELLASREQEHRKQLELRLQPGGADFQQAVSKEVAAVEQRRQQREAELQEKLAEGRKLYAALEDEFRMALTIEATRFSEVKEACDHMTAELMELKTSLAQSQQKEKKSGALVQELTAMVKEQKTRISELIKAKKDAVAELKNRVHYLEAEGEQSQRLGLQLETLKKEKARLVSQLTAQESVIDGLRAERRIWGQELAQQGASLAQDRGRLEARIEVLTAEMETQRKQNDRDHDALRIKAKIVDDQTETIRKLKESLQERDELNRRLKEEAVQTQKKFQQQLEDETSQQAELKEQLVHLSLRKEELKQQLEDKEAELEDAKRVYSDSNKKWQEKAELLTRLESQVKRMKENFDSKERLLLEEREKASEAHRAAVDKLRSVDDAFRRQLESVQAAHQAELLQLSNEKQKHIEQANLKVYEVEEEMRQLLEETEANKKVMEEKMKRLTNVLKDFNT
ncbi:leucine-rich repeat and coiled-coil domain-containing protein 1 isoform X2 [Poecilia latipinna]|uniref:leucine-rich repeat and coiled-coil domain-containing protein 1 isoform X2 n=1 Tax=Poecilia formosa TaxID=48698 RepID=UPI00044410D1|nr:PREDICTED: leucine-rich repeat and coiled-coil domain-containing protein 1 isoform X2 [Poecilia formosa]XP_014887485.1 PREDICTED: leucine-rich repeat and coiled-coil domain-containing protein 1 isoform X2 [Poecilia latipinna]